MKNEVWKDIPEYEGLYQASSLGNIKSLIQIGSIKERILKPGISKGYFRVGLYKNKNVKMISVHQLIAIAFHNHIPNGSKAIVDHKDFDKLNNKSDNLRIITNRENTNKKHLESSSEYIGVSWHKRHRKWSSQIEINRKLEYLGLFTNEKQASKAYNEALELHSKGESIQPIISKYHRNHTSQYKGVSWSKQNKKWQSQITINKKHRYLGYFTNEYDAHLAYQEAKQRAMV